MNPRKVRDLGRMLRMEFIASGVPGNCHNPGVTARKARGLESARADLLGEFGELPGIVAFAAQLLHGGSDDGIGRSPALKEALQARGMVAARNQRHNFRRGGCLI